ncbi:MAG TPA: DegQ family serine endoprotease [Stenotrophobium sp.]|jgi:serine protease Do/serine protease DegQ|nr:DegQ family serine endoprotease [Stenotrophobium sp.]
MSRDTLFKIFTPLAVSASILGAAFMMSGAPTPVAAHSSAAAVMGAGSSSLPLQNGVPSLAPMLKQVMPAVVNIAVTSKVEIQNPLLNDPFFRRFFGVPDQQQQPQTQEAQAIGSGVIVDAAKGYVLTNNHVVDQADTIKVRLNDDREYNAKLIGTDPATDIAVLQIKADNLTALPIADSDKLEVGDFVVAIGSPFNLRQTVTSGIVSGLGRNGLGDGYEDFIQTDASINPGNSGGALVNLKGQLVGINSMILSQSGGNIGIGFAIPTNLATGIMKQLIDHGSVERGHIGITGQDLTPDLAKAFGLSDTHGALVSRVLPKSPADKAGIEAEDVILAANGKPIESFSQLRTIVGLMRVGDKVDLKILRKGKTRNITVTIGKDVVVSAAGAELNPRLAGATFGAVDESTQQSEDVHGVLVKTVAQGSPAAQAGLQPGDIITSVNRQPINNMDQFRKLAGSKSKQLLLRIRRGDGALFLLLE